MNRLSTASFYQRSIDQMSAASQRLEKAQTQVATGKRVVSAKDDPVAAPIAAALRQAMSRRDDFNANIDAARRTLNSTETGLNTMETSMIRVRDLALNAGDGTLNATDLKALAVEVRLRMNEMLGQLNAKDPSGEYLYSGYKGSTQPFVQQADGSVIYQGDAGVRTVQIGPNLSVADRLNGRDTFTRLAAPISATSVISGGFGVDGPYVTDVQAFNAVSNGSLVVNFSASGVTATLDGVDVPVTVGSTQSAPGVATPWGTGQTIEVLGVSFTPNATPANGDAVTLTTAPASKLDLISGLDRLADVLEQGGQGGNLTAAISATVSFMDTALDQLNAMRSQVGVSLNLLDAAEQSNLDEEIVDSAYLSQLEDADLAKAISDMTLAETTLQASQQTFARISNLSLFNYLN